MRVFRYSEAGRKEGKMGNYWKKNYGNGEYRLKTDLFTIWLVPDGDEWDVSVMNKGAYSRLDRERFRGDVKAAKECGVRMAKQVLTEAIANLPGSSPEGGARKG